MQHYGKLFAASVVSNLGDGVGMVAYPWLASAVTRNPLLIATIVVAQRLPWLGFTLIAGVITDRVDRRRLMIVMDTARGVVTALVAIVVAWRSSALPAPNAVTSRTGTDVALYLTVVVATLLLGLAEVLRDNAAQTLLPAIVPAENLERANGRMWSAESVANTVAGPPLGSLLVAAAFALPIVFDAASFFAAAALLCFIPGTFRATADSSHDTHDTHWRAELGEGVRWLWGQPTLRTMALVLGAMNLAGTLSMSLLVLFVQDVLHRGATTFAVIGMGGALGAIIGAAAASRLSRRFGSGTCLAITLATLTVTAPVVGLARSPAVLFAMFAVETAVGALWNVITVSLRQTVIPPRLLGRVNSVYRFLAWGTIPLGALLGGAIVTVVTALTDRQSALRSVWFVNGALHLILFVVGRRRLSTARLEALRIGET